MTTLGMGTYDGDNKYLGLPYMVGSTKRKVFAFVKERVWKKTHGWKEKLLFRAKKEILIKSMLKSLLTYVMSVFSLPTTLLC